MAIELISTIKPKNNGSFPVVEDNDIKGGYHSVTSIVMRDAIPVTKRSPGMLCYVSDTRKIYKLSEDLTTWIEFTSGGGDVTEMETTELTSSALGGIPVGEDLNGKTVIEILTMMLYPYVKPTISATGTPNGGIFEVGNTQTITNVNVVITKKSKKITKVEVFDGATSLGLLEDDTIANGGTFNFPVNVEVASVNKQLTATVTDEQGSEVSSKTGAFTFVYPYYWGSSDDIPTADTILLGTEMIESKGNKTLKHNAANQYVFIAYPANYGNLTSILDSNSFEYIDSFTKIEVSVNGVNYYCYYIGKLTATGFKFTYKH